MVDFADANGIRRQKTFERKKDAGAYFARVRVEIADGVHVADRATVSVAQAGDDWLKSCESAGLERTTIDMYRNHLELHLKPFKRGLIPTQIAAGVTADSGKKDDDIGNAMLTARYPGLHALRHLYASWCIN